MPDKKLSFTFGIDQASLALVERSIKGLIADMKVLVDLSSKVGMGGGGMMHVSSIGGMTTQQATALSKTPMAAPMGQGLYNQQGIFKEFSKGIGDALKDTNQAVRDSVRGQIGELKALEKEIGQVVAGYSALDKSNALSPTALSGDVDSSFKNARTLSGRAPSSWFSNFVGGGMGAFSPATMGNNLKAIGGGIMNQVANAMGIPVSVLKAGGLGIGALLYGAKGIDTELDQNPFRFLKYTAQKSQLAWNETAPLLQGDFSNLTALRTIMADKNKREDYGAVDSSYRRGKKNAYEVLAGAFTADWTRASRGWSGEAADIDIRQERQKMMQTEKETDPMRYAVQQEMREGFRGRLSMMRTLGIGGGRNNLGYDALTRFQSAYSQFDMGEIAGAKTGIQGAGTRAASFALLGNALQAQAAGIQGAAGIGGTMSRFGIGAGQDFLSALRVAAGGGMDVTTAGLLGQFVAQSAPTMQGQNGLGMLGMLSMNTGGAGGRLIAEQNIKGAGALQNVLSGGLDPYQSARNLQIAMNTAPGAGIYKQDYLARNLNLSQMADIIGGGGQLDPMMLAAGVTPGDVKGMFAGTTKSLYERMISGGFKGTRAEKTIKSMMASGLDPNAWFKQQQKRKGFTQAEGEQDVADYGFALSMSEGLAPEAGMGLARDIFGMGRGAKTKGGMAGDVGGLTTEAHQAAKELELMSAKAAEAVGNLANFNRELEDSVYAMIKHNEWQGLKEGERLEKEKDMAKMFDMLSGNTGHHSFADLDRLMGTAHALRELDAKQMDSWKLYIQSGGVRGSKPPAGWHY